MEDGALKVRVFSGRRQGQRELSVPVAAAAAEDVEDGETAPGITGVPDGISRRGNNLHRRRGGREGNLRPRETPGAGSEYDVRVL